MHLLGAALEPHDHLAEETVRADRQQLPLEHHDRARRLLVAAGARSFLVGDRTARK